MKKNITQTTIMRRNEVRMSEIHVFIVGSAGIPARYGGFETFVEELTAGKQNQDIHYHVSCMKNRENEKYGDVFEYNNAECFKISVPPAGAFGRMLYVHNALKYVEGWVKYHPGTKNIVYILGCRVGQFMDFHYKKLKQLGVVVMVNPDGLEWKRKKWSFTQAAFIKQCERHLVTHADKIICDSKNIRKYINRKYPKQKSRTIWIAYGAKTEEPYLEPGILEDWYKTHELEKGNYYIVIGRFVPDNNYELIIREFMKSDTTKKLVFVTNAENNSFYYSLADETGFEEDKRIKFVGTVYDRALLWHIRANAFGYIHGHEVGGTNPSLLESLATSNINIVYDVGFNREVALHGALYFNSVSGSLSNTLSIAEELTEKEVDEIKSNARKRIEDVYSWPIIIKQYEDVFASAFSDRSE